MSGVAGSRLAVAVTRAGGLGQIGFTGDPMVLDKELTNARRQLQKHELANESKDGRLLPIAAGIIVFGTLCPCHVAWESPSGAGPIGAAGSRMFSLATAMRCPGMPTTRSPDCCHGAGLAVCDFVIVRY
jgi:NAD(P)H-dependent flavin oxidoreductase YrpB (nitropropane dioxygenase family)